METATSDRSCESCTDVDGKMNGTLTAVQQFYNGKNVLITGATGFLGKVLVEKLLRGCPSVENVYLLVRQKKGKDINTRIDEMFENPLFDLLKKQQPKFIHKVVAVAGDCEEAGLGLSLEDRKMLAEKVNIIFHSAATIKFDEHLPKALKINVRAASDLLTLAKEMKNLDVLLHVSTAFSNCHLSHIKEQFYPFEADYEQLQQMSEKLTDKEIDDLTPTILGPWPNTYTFTKALGEKVVRENASGMPVGIFRPGTVISTYREPIRNWLDNVSGPTGLAISCEMGFFHVLQCDLNTLTEIIPADTVVNCIIVAAARVNTVYKMSTPPQEPPIFNYVSSVENRLTYGDYTAHNLANSPRNPLPGAVWHMSIIVTKSAFVFKICDFFVHLLPGALYDGLAVCLGKKPRMLKIYKKIHKLLSVHSYFYSNNKLTFCNKNTQELWSTTSDEDKKIFPFSMRDVNWDEFFHDHHLGIRRYIFKESDDTLPQHRLKCRRLYYLHQIVKTAFYVIVIYVLWSIYNYLLKMH